MVKTYTDSKINLCNQHPYNNQHNHQTKWKIITKTKSVSVLCTLILNKERKKNASPTTGWNRLRPTATKQLINLILFCFNNYKSVGVTNIKQHYLHILQLYFLLHRGEHRQSDNLYLNSLIASYICHLNILWVSYFLFSLVLFFFGINLLNICTWTPDSDAWKSII